MSTPSFRQNINDTDSYQKTNSGTIENINASQSNQIISNTNTNTNANQTQIAHSTMSDTELNT